MQDHDGEYHERCGAIYREVNRRIDMNNNDMVDLVHSVATHGSLSQDRYRRLIAKGHPPSHVDAAARIAEEAHASWILVQRGKEVRLAASVHPDEQ